MSIQTETEIETQTRERQREREYKLAEKSQKETNSEQGESFGLFFDLVLYLSFGQNKALRFR